MVSRSSRPPRRIQSVDQPQDRGRKGAFNLRMLVVLLILCGFVGWYVWATVSVDTEPIITLDKSMKEAFDKQKFADTETFARRFLPPAGRPAPM